MPFDAPTNRLALEQSPYLLQHASNPVAWYPWSNEAFEEARAENKPVFVSIGYATCHWCHVMAHESFEDKAVADFLNEHYICIKVDREERPDVDAICMDVCQSLTGHGGWPLTIMMDADRRPFFAGTYFPRNSFGNRLGFLDLVQRLHEVWVLDHARVVDTAKEIADSLTKQAESDFRGDVPPDVMDIVVDHHKRMYDDVHGGFSIKPKFPSPHHLLLLLRAATTSDDKGLLSMVCTTLEAMRSGGIYDQVGYGFHRYSTDREWLVPHFEKMLYDQAMMMMAYTEAWQITHDEVYKRVVLEIAEYLQREMTDVSGAFYSAQDADSEGEEGKYYIWSEQEWKDVSPELTALLNIRADGNFHDEATGDPSTSNIPHVDLGSLRALLSNDEWSSVRPQFLARRAERVPPLTDDKILTDWNGLMIGALARAGRAFNESPLTALAERAYRSFTHPVMFHRLRNGQAAVESMLDDHAMMGWAGLELYQTTGETQFLRDALDYADIILDRFSDENGALFTVSRDVTDVPVRQKHGYDGAYPCGNSMSALLFAGIGAITNSRTYREAAHACVRTYGTQLSRSAPGFCMLLCAWDTLANGSTEIVINGAKDSSFITKARTFISSTYRPRSYIIYRPVDEQGASLLREASYPFDAYPENSVLVCNDYVCDLPLTGMT